MPPKSSLPGPTGPRQCSLCLAYREIVAIVHHDHLGTLRVCRLCNYILPLVVIAHNLPSMFFHPFQAALDGVRACWDYILSHHDARSNAGAINAGAINAAINAVELSPGWIQCWSEEYGIPYYWNIYTEESLWERPTGNS